MMLMFVQTLLGFRFWNVDAVYNKTWKHNRSDSLCIYLRFLLNVHIAVITQCTKLSKQLSKRLFKHKGFQVLPKMLLLSLCWQLYEVYHRASCVISD